MIDSLSTAATSMNGTLHGSDRGFRGLSTDSRSVQPGELFFALQGPNFDGHDYVAAASAGGAAGAVVARRLDNDISQIEVDDAVNALGRFASTWRAGMDVQVIGVTGSNGKTTVKELIAACLGSTAATLATEGNLNNHIGMPMMLARIDSGHKFAVIEMGANHAGEIAYLASLANPDVVVITNAGAAHLEGFGSIEGVAQAKGEILRNQDRPDFAVLNADDDYFDYWRSLVSDVEVRSFGLGGAADVRAEHIVATGSGSQFDLHIGDKTTAVSLPLPGIHNVRNACAAAAVADVLNIESDAIRVALEGVAPVSGRLQPLAGINGCALFDDSYNANPLSVTAAAEFLAQLDGEHWLVLGDMKELGDDARELHREVGASARACGVHRLFALGDFGHCYVDGFGEGATAYTDIDALLSDLLRARDGINVLVKGSRSMRMERVVDAMREAQAERREA